MIEHPQLKAYQLNPPTLKDVEIINVSGKPTYIHHWEGLDLELAEFDYKHDRTTSAESIPTQTSNPSICRDYKCSKYYYV